MEGTFINFEGCEGSGKSTIAKMIEEEMKKRGISFLLTREPGGTPISEKIREIILNPSTPEMDPRTEALLYAAARAQHTHEKIIPALKEGKIVLCDRYIESSLAYQGAARGLDIEEIEHINDFGTDDLRVQYVFFFDVKPEISLQRIQERYQLDRLEQETIDFHNRVYDYYDKKCRQKRWHEWQTIWVRIDAAQPIDKVCNDVLEYIENHILYDGLI